jgi:hypothetical protein
VCAAALAVCSGAVSAAPVTWYINTPWDFYTSSSPAQGNLVGTITFDRAVSASYPISYSFTLQHHDPVLAPYFPFTISSGPPGSVSYYGVNGWILWNATDPSNNYIAFNFDSAPGTLDAVVDGTATSVNFMASEWIYRFPYASNRLIYNGTATLVPAPGAAAPMAMGGLLAARRRRR